MVSEPTYGHLMGVIGTGLLSREKPANGRRFSSLITLSPGGDEQGEASVRRLSRDGTVFTTHKTAINRRIDHTGET